MAAKAQVSKSKVPAKKSVSKTASKPKGQAKRKPATLRTAKNSPSSAQPTSSKPKDTVSKESKEANTENTGRFSSFLDNVQGAFGQLGGSLQPLDFSDKQKQEGLKAADTVGRLGGSDGTWDSSDLANNLAQMQTSGGIRGRIESSVARNGLFDAHNVPEEERAGITEQSYKLKQDNPNIARLHKLEQINPEKITDPAKRAKYDELTKQLTTELTEKGLMPVGIPALQQMGQASEVLQTKLKEAGLPVPQGQPVDVEQYRGLFQGKAPMRTQLGF